MEISYFVLFCFVFLLICDKEVEDSPVLKTQCSKSHLVVSENDNTLVTISGISFPEKGMHLFLRLFLFGEEIES